MEHINANRDTHPTTAATTNVTSTTNNQKSQNNKSRRSRKRKYQNQKGSTGANKFVRVSQNSGGISHNNAENYMNNGQQHGQSNLRFQSTHNQLTSRPQMNTIKSQQQSSINLYSGTDHNSATAIYLNSDTSDTKNIDHHSMNQIILNTKDHLTESQTLVKQIDEITANNDDKNDFIEAIKIGQQANESVPDIPCESIIDISYEKNNLIEEITKHHNNSTDDSTLEAKELNLSTSGQPDSIWNSFSLVGSSVDDCVIECNICQQKHKYNAQRVTTTMLNHLQSHHTDERVKNSTTLAHLQSMVTHQIDENCAPAHVAAHTSPEPLVSLEESTIELPTNDYAQQNLNLSDGNELRGTSLFAAPQSEESDIITVDSRPPEEVLLELKSAYRSREQDMANLPSTVTRLETGEGAPVYLVGTSHFSKKSIEDVILVMQAVKPSAVVLELCREREIMLQLGEEQLLAQCGSELSLETFRQAIAKAGAVQGTIFVLFLKLSASLTKKLGMAPGGEFRAAAREASGMTDCRLYFGDRSLKITFARAVNSLTLWQKLKFVYSAMTSNVSDMTQDELEKFKETDILEELLKQLADDFPAFKKVLLDERNTYLAHNIYAIANAQNLNNATVAVVGIGHVQGIVENWGKTKDSDIQSIITIPEKSLASKLIGKGIKYTLWGAIAYAGFRLVCPTQLQSNVASSIGSIFSNLQRLRPA